MPRPPNIDGLDKISFITNYFMNGCIPPYYIFVQFSHEPIGNLFALLFSFDLQDIVKGLLRPHSPRHSSPGRHGAKGRKGLPSLDVNESIVAMINESTDHAVGIPLGGAKALFYISDIYDAVNFTTGIVEGVTDIGYDVVWGALKNRPDLCPGMKMLSRRVVTNEGILPIIQPYNPINLSVLEYNTGLASTDGFGCANFTGPMTVSFTSTCRGDTLTGSQGVKLVLLNQFGTVKAESFSASIAAGEEISLGCSGEFAAGEHCQWVGHTDSGNVLLTHTRAFAFSGDLL